MVTATLTPRYYRVEIDMTAPSNWTTATDATNAGAIDNTTAEKYNRTILITGTVDTPVLTPGKTLYINDVLVTFSGAAIADAISDINGLTPQTGVYADNQLLNNCITLRNWVGYEGANIWLKEGSGGLAELGLAESVYSYWPCETGSGFTAPVVSEDILINGVTVTWTGITAALCAADINTLTWAHQVVAYVVGDSGTNQTLQLCSAVGQPWVLQDGSTGVVSDIGFVAGNHGGTPLTYAQSIDKERANMRWDGIVNKLGELISPIYLSVFDKTGTIDGTAAVDSLEFTIAYDRANYLSTEDETSPGDYLVGTDCIKRLIARALIKDYSGNQEIFDPTITNFGTKCARVNPTQILPILAAKLETLVTNVEPNITVTPLLLK